MTQISNSDAIEQARQQLSEIKELADMDVVMGINGEMLCAMVRMYTMKGWATSKCHWSLNDCSDVRPLMMKAIASVRKLAEEIGIVPSMRVPAPGGVGTALVYLDSEGQWIFR